MITNDGDITSNTKIKGRRKNLILWEYSREGKEFLLGNQGLDFLIYEMHWLRICVAKGPLCGNKSLIITKIIRHINTFCGKMQIFWLLM